MPNSTEAVPGAVSFQLGLLALKAAIKKGIHGVPPLLELYDTLAPALLPDRRTLPWGKFKRLTMEAMPEDSWFEFQCLPEFHDVYISMTAASPSAEIGAATEVAAAAVAPAAPQIQTNGRGDDQEAMDKDREGPARICPAAEGPRDEADSRGAGASLPPFDHGGGSYAFDDNDVLQSVEVDMEQRSDAAPAAEANLTLNAAPNNIAVAASVAGGAVLRQEVGARAGWAAELLGTAASAGMAVAGLDPAGHAFEAAEGLEAGTMTDEATNVLPPATVAAQRAVVASIKATFDDMAKTPANWADIADKTGCKNDMLLYPAVLTKLGEAGAVIESPGGGDDKYVNRVNIAARFGETVFYMADGSGPLWADNSDEFIKKARELAENEATKANVRVIAISAPGNDDFCKNRAWILCTCPDEHIIPELKELFEGCRKFTPRTISPGYSTHQGHVISTLLLIKKLCRRKGVCNEKRNLALNSPDTPDGDRKRTRRESATAAADNIAKCAAKEEASTPASLGPNPLVLETKEAVTRRAVMAGFAQLKGEAFPELIFNEPDHHALAQNSDLKLSKWVKDTHWGSGKAVDLRQLVRLTDSNVLRLYIETDQNAHRNYTGGGYSEFMRMAYYAQFDSSNDRQAWLRICPDGLINGGQSREEYNQAIHQALEMIIRDALRSDGRGMPVYFLFYGDDHRYADHDEEKGRPFHVNSFEDRTLPCGEKVRVAPTPRFREDDFNPELWQ